jgi:hypothetical protein
MARVGVWAGSCGHQGAPFAVWGKNSGIAVAMVAWRRDQSGQPVQKVQGCQLDVIASPNISRGQLVEQLLVIDAGQAVGGENRPGAVSEQSLTVGVLSTLGVLGVSVCAFFCRSLWVTVAVWRR